MIRRSSSSTAGDGGGDSPPRVTHYDSLDLTRNASSDEIKEAYYKLSKEFHPDINPENSEALKR